MKTKILSAAFCGLALAAPAWDSTENAIWFEGSLKGKLTDSVSIKLSEQIRHKDEGNFYYYRHTDIGAEWIVAKNWSGALAYRYTMARKSGSEWVAKPMAHANLKNKTVFGPAELRTRLRFSYLFLDGSEDLIDCRPKFALMPSKGWTGWKLKPYAATELMYNFEDNLLYRTRVGAGLTLCPVKKLSLNLFMMQERTRLGNNSNWTEAYHMGLMAGVAF